MFFNAENSAKTCINFNASIKIFFNVINNVIFNVINNLSFSVFLRAENSTKTSVEFMHDTVE